MGGANAGKRQQVYCSQTCNGLARPRSRKTCNELDPLDAAYFAGFTDADGSMGIYVKQRPRGRQYHLQVGVVQVYPSILEDIRNTTGVGSVGVMRRETKERRAVWQWCATGEGAAGYLAQLRPFLRVKQARADVCLEFHELRKDPSNALSEDWQEELRLRIVALNRKGPERE